ncbi:MAG: cytochrome C biosynthesis protein [Desulfobacteraceae bacterium]|nr:cytochrome C biosynthesis protein [Desulfobacteraceae bacterium]
MFDNLFLTINTWMSGDIGFALVGCFAWGVISILFSPCHLASIPLIVSYVAGQNQTLDARHAARYAIAFTFGLFITIAALGIICSLLGRMLGQISPYWTILVGAILVWVSLDMLGIKALSLSGGGMSRIKVKGLVGAFVLGLSYGLLSGSCTFGFIAPILAFITIEGKIVFGITCIVLFGIGHCLPIAVAGSSAALVRKVLESKKFQTQSSWFRKIAGVAIMGFGVYFIGKPFIGT